MVAIPFAYNVSAANMSQFGSAHGLSLVESDGLHLDSGLEYFTGLEATSFDNFDDITIINKLEPNAPQTLTTAQYSNLQLIAGETLVIDYSYIPTDDSYDDFAFSLLKDAQGNVTPIILGDENNYNASGGQTGFTVSYTINATGSYDLMFASADGGDALEPSTLIIHSLSAQVPQGGYTLTGSGVRLSDGSFINPDGSFIPSGGVASPGVFSTGAAELVTGLDHLIGAGIISQDGNGLVSHDGGSLLGPGGIPVISNDGGSVLGPGGSGLISQDGNGLVSNSSGTEIAENTDSLISQDGNGVFGQGGVSIISQDGNGVVSHDGGSATGNIYSAMFLDEAGSLTRQFTGTPVPLPPPGPAVPGDEFLIGPSAVAPFFETVPAVAALADGDFAVAWRATAGSQVSIQVQLETPGGAGLATITPIATHALDSISMDPIVLGLSSGGFAVVYVEGYVAVVHGVVSSPANVYAQLFDGTGAKLGGPSLLAATEGLQVSDLAAVALPDGSFVTTATHYDETTTVTSLVAQRYTDSGATIGDALVVATDAATPTNINTQGQAITGLANGGFAVAFANVAFAFGPGALQTGMYVQIFDNVGAVGAPVLIRSASAAVTKPAIATLSDGNFVVAWNEVSGTNNTEASCNAQVVSPAGTLIGSVIVGPTGLIDYDPPAVTALADGRFILAYEVQSAGSGGNDSLVQAQIYNADGTVSGDVIAGNAPDPATFIASPAIVQIGNGTIELLSEHSGGAAGGSDIHDEPLALSSAAEGANEQGRAVDGDLAGATVFADANGDGVYEAGEAIATTDALGRYNFITPASGTVILTGGTDDSTGLAFTGTLTAPAGSLTVSPLSTLVQKIVAGGSSLVEAQLKVSAAFGLAIDTDFTTLDPVRSTLESLADGPLAFVASTTVQDVVSLAIAAGAVGDVYGKLAAQIAAGTGSFDPTTLAAMQGLGLSGDAAAAAAALAAAGHALALRQMTVDAANPSTLLSDGADIELVEQGAAATALTTGVNTQNFGPVIAAYTGANLTAATGVAAPCFVSGSKIASRNGEVAVEALAVGDMLLTAAGKLRAVTWLGFRHVDCLRHPRPHDVWPVRIFADAFGPGMPHRDLWLSPDHAVFIDGVLIPIRYLINDRTIVREARDEVIYWHVELDRHAVLLAEGLPCESYLDTGNCAAFAKGGLAVHNGAEPQAAHSHVPGRAGSR